MKKTLSDPNQPKRPLTAFFKYLISRKADMKNIKMPEISKIIAEEWKNLSLEEKKKWNSLPEG